VLTRARGETEHPGEKRAAMRRVLSQEVNDRSRIIGDADRITMERIYCSIENSVRTRGIVSAIVMILRARVGGE
jgi:hypothetical protein